MGLNAFFSILKKGNFLLCTILLGNVLVNSVSTLLLGDMLSGVYAALGSTILIVIFGEIIPQAACSKHGLAVGANTRYIMYLFMGLTSPLSFPLSIILDKVLGQEIVATYNREKLRELMMNVDDLDDKEKKIITGALDFNKKKVREIMTKLDDVFMLEISSRLDFEAIARIAQEGYSRIPVYQGIKEEVVGLLHVKDFTLLDPDDNMPVRALLEFYNHSVIKCDAEKPIDEMFEEFRKGETHLAFVTDVFQYDDRDPIEKCVGIVTLEDILEELVQMEIYDEFDDKKESKKNSNIRMESKFLDKIWIKNRPKFRKNLAECLNLDIVMYKCSFASKDYFCSEQRCFSKTTSPVFFQEFPHKA
jgi:metal transporter CNNM